MKRIFFFGAILALLLSWSGCNVDDQFDGPDLNDLYGPFEWINLMQVNRDSVDFGNGESLIASAKFSKRVNWHIDIKGLSSGAWKELTGFDADVAAEWDGSTTHFPMFRSESCAIAMYVVGQPDTLRDTVFVVAPKVNPGLLLSDFEGGLNPNWVPFVQSGANMNFGLQQNGSAPQGLRSYIMAGAVSWDWLIGMIDIPASAYGADHFDLSSNPNNVYFNTLLYKPADYDNGLVLLRFSEDDNLDGSFDPSQEDMYSYQLQGGEDGWRLLSLKYSDLQTLVNGNPATPAGNGLHEPDKLFQVSILFLANPASGYSESGLDYMIFTEGEPLRP
jgi:hypothetical protein